MEALKISEIVQAVEGQLMSGDPQMEIINISIDSRTIQPGMFFVPLKGENFDGHNYIEQAFEKGAVGCVAEFVGEDDLAIPICGKQSSYSTPCIIKVKNTLKALQAIAAYYRRKFHISFIGVTGSVGKTSTKDMIACVLEKKYKVLKTMGNFNNEVGLPLTVFRADSQHEMAVTEMGMSGFGEISRISSIVNPETAVITNIGLSHIEKLGSQKNILKAKMEIFQNFQENNTAILNGDDPMLFRLKGTLPYKLIYYGIHNEKVDIKAENIILKGDEGSVFELFINNQDYTVYVPVLGEHNIYNTLAAIAVGLTYNMDMDEIIEGISNFQSDFMRLHISEFKNGVTAINDCYNASPASMEAAIDVLKQIKGHRKIAVLGDMLEMGDWALEAHKKIGNYVSNTGIDYLLTLGYNGKNIAMGGIDGGMPKEYVYCFDTKEEIIDFLKGFLRNGDTVLVKGSRGMKMESILEHIREVR